MDLGTIMDIGHLLNKAYALYTGYNDAPEEISLAAEHVHGMRLLLKGVETDIINNKTSFWHQDTDMAKNHKLELKRRLRFCNQNLERGEDLLQKYKAFQKQGISTWDRWKWSHHGKQDLKETENGLMMATHELEAFMARVGLSVLWKVENLMEQFSKKMENIERWMMLHHGGKGVPPPVKPPQKRGRSQSNVAPTLYAGLFISRLKTKVRLKRKKNAPKIQKHNPATGKLKPLTKVNSGFKQNKKRTSLFLNHVATTAASHTKPASPPRQRPRTPSPKRNQHNIFGPPLRRTSSLSKLQNPKTTTPPQTPEHLECWRIGTGQYFLGPKLNRCVQHKRGQAQLKKMAAVFKEVSQFDKRGLGGQDSRVKEILKLKNEREKSMSKRKWVLVAARVVVRDAGKTGVVRMEKALVIVGRRG